MIESVTALDFFLKSIHETCSTAIILLCSGMLMLNNVQPYDRENSYLLGRFSVEARGQVVQVVLFWGSFSDLGKTATMQK